MRVSAKAPSLPSHLPRIAQWFSGAKTSKKAKAPSAEFTPVPASKQVKVRQGVQAALIAQLEGHVPRARQAAVQQLVGRVGQPDFYDTLAKLDPGHAREWTEMGRVQRQFAAVEPKYDAKTLAYSQSMRLTLHASVVQHFAAPKTNQGVALYDRFIALHPTAFHQNGGWVDNLQIPAAGAMAVAQATPAEMWLHAAGLFQGSFITDAPTVTAAQLVRDARLNALSGWSP